MNIRKSLSRILSQYGYDAIYIRRDKRFRCECYSERAGGTALIDCNLCFGTTYYVNVERIRTRRKISSVPESIVRSRDADGSGVGEATAFLYYIEHTVKPKAGDIILEVEWENNKPKNIIDKNIISVADPKHGLNGRIEFYQAYCKYDYEGRNDYENLTKS